MQRLCVHRKLLLLGCAALGLGGCPLGATFDERNAFLTFTDTFGASATRPDGQGGAGAGGGTVPLEATFRKTMMVVLANLHPTAELQTSFAAWVLPSSIRSADQQDELLRGGYVQLAEELRLGRAFTLPPGTFVFNGPGTAGATPVTLPPTGAEDNTVDPALATTMVLELITPDVILVFYQPPDSCESVAFFFAVDGQPLDSEPLGPSGLFSGPSSPFSGLKTLAQVDAYQCRPFQPGLFLRIGGGQPAANEFNEGDTVLFEFSPVPDGNGFFATVTRIAGAP